METRLTGQDMALEGANDDEDERFAPIGYLTDENAEPSRIIEAEQWDRVRSTGLDQALKGLDARSRRIVEARWLNEANPATLHELAAEFKVSAERIRQIEQKAMQKMRGQLAAVAN
jgi:RNA polymerase sigma-32 factor